ncbi:GNAT family N-acetyltransferase [Aquimarina muelleri]|uniref:GNAT family N-acetyltransferase n=1 Tax=Aquimarina muelleri TaxID=279356 RepID=UPI003F683CEB
MEFIKLTQLSKAHKTEILTLWNNEYPEKLNYQTLTDFDNYLKNLKEQSHILIMDKSLNIKGWYFDFICENEKWFAILLDTDTQKKGFGTKILNLAKNKETQLNGWVIDHNNDIKKKWKTIQIPFRFLFKK